jgi:transketolase
MTDESDIIGITKFGESAPGEKVMKAYGFSVENITERETALLK